MEDGRGETEEGTGVRYGHRGKARGADGPQISQITQTGRGRLVNTGLTARAVDEHHLEVTNGHLEPGRIYAVVARPPVAGSGRTDRSFPSLRGSVLQYDDPFGPAIDPSEWEALKDPPARY